VTVIATTVEGKKIVDVTVSGPTSYTTGGFPVTFSELDSVLYVLSAKANAGLVLNAYVATQGSNVVNVQAFWEASGITANQALVEVAAGTNLSADTFEIIAIGY